MSNKNPIPEEYFNEPLSQEQMEGLAAAAEEAEQYLQAMVWTEMDESYFEALRVKLNKGEDEIGPRQFKSYKLTDGSPYYLMVIPAGKQHNGEKMVAYYHTILEDMEWGECNGEYKLVSESELSEIFNINYNK